MKSKRHNATTFEFGFAPDTFKLFGEVVKQAEAPAVKAPDTTLDLFVDRLAVEQGRETLQRDLS